jgi:hypothetical protein
MNELVLVQQIDQQLALKSKEQIQRRIAILGLEDWLLDQGNEVNDQDQLNAVCPLKHHFSPGVYMREIFIPKGTILTGALHVKKHQVIMGYGKIAVFTEMYSKIFEGYNVFESMIGEKRVGIALEDTMWTTIHPNPNNYDDPELLKHSFAKWNKSDIYKEYLKIDHLIPKYKEFEDYLEAEFKLKEIK